MSKSINWLKEHKATLGIVLAIIIIFLVILLIFSINSPRTEKKSNEITNFQSMSQVDLEQEKLRQEVRQLWLENANLANPLQKVTSIATIVTIIVAVVGAFGTIWKQFLERQKDREQREAESKRQLDEKFSSIIKDLGSENNSLKVSAAVSLMTFLRKEYSEFHEQVYLVLLANLKIKQDIQLNRLLIQAFSKALRLKLGQKRGPDEEEFLDLTNTNLYRIDLSGLDLSNLDMAFAILTLANLRETNLFRAKGYQVNLEKASLTKANLNEVRFTEANLENAHLHQTNLVSSNLKKANLKGAEFFEAKLQAARLDEADISGARFEKADLNDAYFLGAKIPNDTLKSIRKAFHWECAHFDEETKSRLNALDSTLKQ
jgi:uncharacterized protein YjbI with pentapeptide repeats